MRHYELADGQSPEGSNRSVISYDDKPELAKVFLESKFSNDLTIFGEVSLFCSYAYHQRAYYVMMDAIASEPSWNLERILTGPPQVDANGNWTLRGTTPTAISGQTVACPTSNTRFKNRFIIEHRYVPAQISADMFPVESSLHRSLAQHPCSSLEGELSKISIEVQGFGFRHRHEDEYALQSVAHLFAFLLMRHPGDETYEEVLCRAASNCLFPSVLNAKSVREDQQYFAAVAAKYAFTGQPLPEI